MEHGLQRRIYTILSVKMNKIVIIAFISLNLDRANSQARTAGARIPDSFWTEVDGIRAAGPMIRLRLKHDFHGLPRVPGGGRDCRQPVLCDLQW